MASNEDVVSAAPPAYTAAVDQQPAPTTTLPQTGLPPQPQFIQLQKGAYPQQIAYAGQQPVVVGSQPVPTYVYPQQQVVPGVPPVQQMQYVVPSAAAPPVSVLQTSNYDSPPTFLILTIIVMILCSILNITSLAFGIPALIMAIMAQERVTAKDYPSASKRGTFALVLTILNAGYTLAWGVIVIGAITGNFCTSYHLRYYCNYDNY